VPEAVYRELKARGRDVSRLRQFGMWGCATAVMIDPKTGNRFAAADPRRDFKLVSAGPLPCFHFLPVAEWVHP